jgi:DNA-binding NtrC family response regulator
LCETLQNEGFQTQYATNSSTAVDILEADSTISLVFSDIEKPSIDCVLLAKHATSLRPGLRIVFFSGCPDQIDCSEIQPKPFAVMVKPISLSEVVRLARDAQ